ncbi:MAG TPA: Ni/Fe-hydrogenase cytochrome b subunit [Anaeromyxobacteraceae bacterium]|nr:Ni/Fe-hydrogenase cytochrome b subunit [Anaeromyxobacteraceae bacterium]
MASVATNTHGRSGSWAQENLLLGMSFKDYLRSLWTPFNVVAAAILAVGLPVLVMRFWFGLGATTNLSQTQPWGLWIGFDMMTGIALAAGGFTIGAAVEIFNLEEFHAIERPAILTGFLGYLMAVIGLIADLGKPWNMVGIFSNNGTQSVLFEVAWCVACYTTVLFLEFSVPLFEWLGWERFYRPLKKALLALTVLSVMFSTMHQSALGSLFIIAPGKLHPLWYSGQIFIFFFVSAVIAGISMVIVESTISHKVFSSQLEGHHVDIEKITFGLAKAGAVVMFAYFFLKLQGVIDNHALGLIGVGFFGKWWLVEMLGFVLLPSIMYAWGARNRSLLVVRIAAIMGVLGIVLNRLNVSLVAYNYNQPVRYWPSWMEIAVSLALVVIGILAFRWIVNRMPVLRPMKGAEQHH